MKESQIPRANQMNIARVSGPFTNHKKYLDLCLDALGDWFLYTQRIVTKGDIICIPINEFVADVKNEFYCDEDLDIRDDIDEATSDPFKALSYFKVLDITSDGASDTNTSLPSYVVTADTRITQSGAINSLLPKQVNSFYEIQTPTLPTPTPDPTDPHSTLLEILATYFHPSSNLPDCTLCVSAPHGSGKVSLLTTVTDTLGINMYVVDCFNLNMETSASTAFTTLEVHFEKAVAMAPCVFVMKNVDAVVGGGVAEKKEQNALSTLFVDFLKKKVQIETQVAVVATTADAEKLPKEVQGCFDYEIVLPVAPDVLRTKIVADLTNRVALSNDIDRKKLSIQTSGLVPADLVSLVARALSITVDGVSDLTKEKDGKTTEVDIAKSTLVLSSADFEKALSFTKKTQADTIGAPSIPNVTWDDIGGLSHIRDAINDTIQLPLSRPDLFSSGTKKRSGILLFGPPGTGKTLIAKAVATTFSLNFLSVKGPELLNMYIGESEANVRRIFTQARNAKPCVIFFDELDSVAPKRGDKGDSSGGVMDRIVSQLLAELDNVGSTGGDVFVIGATNRPDLLDSALLRPGRFDKMLYLGVSEEKAKQVSVMQALTRKFVLEPGLDLSRVADRMPSHLTGADLYALCSDAMLKAISRTIGVVDKKYAEFNETSRKPQGLQPIPMIDFLESIAKPEHKSVVVGEQDFFAALDELKPSLTPADLAHYAHLQDKFK
ncbi:peroxisomal assembly protein [Rhizoclosmatium sp. JEL0117]|nr:peroxisomal assembly protein [Rhizoclosmatium sp. JEL0117]